MKTLQVGNMAIWVVVVNGNRLCVVDKYLYGSIQVELEMFSIPPLLVVALALIPFLNVVSSPIYEEASIEAFPSAKSLAPNNMTYEIDCKILPNVCQNWCFYRYCKTTGKRKGDSRFVVTLNTTANHRANSECRGPNRCSSTSEDIRGEWSVNPTAGLSCDEQPKNTNNEGGAGAATRCMPASENSHEGSLWGGYIKKNNLVDGDLVTVALALSSFAFFYPSPF
ncbi:hypothetical protein ONZ45_g17971 [Pleurotus djamor]|nr:hypothetical protein ONZ45_g17971 [Pleurotus djamor]